MEKAVVKFNEGVDFEDLYEKDVALKYCVLLALKYAVGQENRLKGVELFKKVREIWVYQISSKDRPPGDRKIRETVRQLRKNGALIISTGGTKGGYWRDTRTKEVTEFVKNEMIARALDELHTGKQMMKAVRALNSDQLVMWGEVTEILKKLNQGAMYLEDV